MENPVAEEVDTGDQGPLVALAKPQRMLPFKILQSEVRELLRKWLSDAPLARDDLDRAANVGIPQGLMVPYWICGARVFCPWQALAGRGEAVTVFGLDLGPGDWEQVYGVVEHVFDDVPIAATTSIRSGLLRDLEPWPMDELVPYDNASVAGYIVEKCDVATSVAAKDARTQMRRLMKNLCEAEIPGDTYRFLRVTPQYSDETFQLVLAPVWRVQYSYQRKTFEVVINGCTGKVTGDAPISAWKAIAAALVIGAVLLGAAAALMTLYVASR